jgi:hypothetical protein
MELFSAFSVVKELFKLVAWRKNLAPLHVGGEKNLSVKD